MSRTLLAKDNISIAGEIIRSHGISLKESFSITLHFNILINGKLKVWGTNYDLEVVESTSDGIKKYGLVNYNAWNDTKDLLCTIGYDISEVNIRNWIDQFDI